MRENSYLEADHPALARLQALASGINAWLLIGSLTIKVDDERMINRSYLVSASGEIVARYDKIHMFDVTLPSGKVIRESSAYVPGTKAVVPATQIKQLKLIGRSLLVPRVFGIYAADPVTVPF